MKLSERIRPNSEAAPWVIREIEAMEAELAEAKERIDEEAPLHRCCQTCGAVQSRTHEGWKLVPVEPTDAFSAWVESNLPSGTVIADPKWWVSRLYRAMIAAAPEAKGGAK